MRVVLDTNIWVSGLLLPNSLAGKVITAWQKNKFNVVISQPILDELEKALKYPKIQKRLNWDSHKIEQYLLLMKFFAEFTSLKQIDSHLTIVRDPNDTPILATLVASQADYLVTGDNDLLCLKQDFAIITLAEFYEMVF